MNINYVNFAFRQRNKRFDRIPINLQIIRDITEKENRHFMNGRMIAYSHKIAVSMIQ